MEPIVAYIRTRKKLLKVVRYFLHWTSIFGIDVSKLFALRGLPAVVKEYLILKRQNADTGSKWNLKFTMPCIHDRYEQSAAVSGHYFHQDLLVARRIFRRQPDNHVDVASRIDGFVAHVAAFRGIEGHLRGFDSLYRILKPGGILYLSFPIGTERIDFNAHRVFAVKTVLEWAKDRFEIVGFSYVDDEGDLHENMTLDATAISSDFNLYYGCGIFELKKI